MYSKYVNIVQPSCKLLISAVLYEIRKTEDMVLFMSKSTLKYNVELWLEPA